MSNPSFFDSLPVEILFEIFFYTNQETRSTAALVNQKFKTIATDNLFWKEKFKHHFPHIFSKLNTENVTHWRTEFWKTYKQEYRKLSKRTRKLFSLVKEEDTASLIPILKLKDLNQLDQSHLSLEHWALYSANQELLDYIYQLAIKAYSSGLIVDTTKKGFASRSILDWAILCHQPTSTIELLILQGADVNALASCNYTPLIFAAIQGHVEIAELLIRRGANINAHSMGATSLLFAVERGYGNLVHTLLQYNADTNISLQISSSYHNQFNVRVGDTPLHAAIKLGCINMVKALLDKGTPIDAAGHSNNTPFMYAAKEGQVEIVELLISRGANINARSIMGATALLFTIEQNHKNIFDILLKHNANINVPLHTDCQYHKQFNVIAGDSPLHAAVTLGHIDMVRILLDKGASVNFLTPDKNTPLMYAAREGRAKIAELLILRCANINARSIMGATALLFAIKNNHKNIVDILLQHNAAINIPLRANSLNRDFFNLIAGDTPFHAAAKLGNPAIVQRLLEKNADIECLNSKHQTPVDVAVKKSRYTSELQLLDYSAKLNRRQDEYKTYNLFGYRFNLSLFGACPAKQKKAAVNALKNVIFEGADKSSLNPHQKALTQGKLKSIYQRLRMG